MHPKLTRFFHPLTIYHWKLTILLLPSTRRPRICQNPQEWMERPSKSFYVNCCLRCKHPYTPDLPLYFPSSLNVFYIILEDPLIFFGPICTIDLSRFVLLISYRIELNVLLFPLTRTFPKFLFMIFSL